MYLAGWRNGLIDSCFEQEGRGEGGGSLPKIETEAEFVQKVDGNPGIRLHSVLSHVEHKVAGLEPTLRDMNNYSKYRYVSLL